MDHLEAILVKHEGLRLFPYQDSVGLWTIGVGRCIERVGISEDEALTLLRNDIAKARADALTFPWFPNLSLARHDVIVSMIFNLGKAGFSEFKGMIYALSAGNYAAAADEMLRSKWAVQVKGRAVELAAMMRSGDY